MTQKTKTVSQYRGVSIDGSISEMLSPRFSARIKGSYLGYFTSEKAAAIAYDEAAKKLFGKNAILNFKEKKSI